MEAPAFSLLRDVVAELQRVDALLVRYRREDDEWRAAREGRAA